jgi:hypothetical protein
VRPFTCDPQEVLRVKDALAKDANNFGVGVLHEPTGRIFLAPYDDLGGGHDLLVAKRHLTAFDCKGFVVILLLNGTFDTLNHSHLNGTQGQPASLSMPNGTYQEIGTTLRQAGL